MTAVSSKIAIFTRDSIDRLWKAAGRPRSGSVFSERQRARLQYRRRIREGKSVETSSYSNELNDALLRKDGNSFWKCWKSKVEHEYRCIEVDGCVDANITAQSFAEFFSNCYSCNSTKQEESLKEEYFQIRQNYVG